LDGADDVASCSHRADSAKFVYEGAETDPLIAALRAELYTTPYNAIAWEGTADHVAAIDNYSPIHPVMRVGNAALAKWERYGGSVLRALRRRGLAFAIDYMAAEDAQTNYGACSPDEARIRMRRATAAGALSAAWGGLCCLGAHRVGSVRLAME
jgi:hypothetical protein